MPTETFSNWVEHGWWIAASNVEAPMLWITKWVLVVGQYWGAFGHERGTVQSISTAPQDVIFVIATMEEGKVGRSKLRRQLMMAAIPSCCLEVHQSMRVLPRLQENWSSMPESLRNVRSEAVQRFQRLSPEDVVRAYRFLHEILAYEEMQRGAPPNARARTPPRAPEESNPIYRVVAGPCQQNWVPIQERGRRRSREGQDADIEASGVRVGQRNVRSNRGRGPHGRGGMQSSRRADASEAGIPVHISTSVRVGSQTERRNNTLPTSVGTTSNNHRPASAEVESCRAGTELARRLMTSETTGVVVQHGRGMEDAQQEQPRLVPRTRGRIERRRGTTVEDVVQREEESQSSEETSDEEDGRAPLHRSPVVGPLVQFPIDDEYLAGYIWGMDFVISVKTENIRNVQNVETNHRALTSRRVAAIYKRLCGRHESNMSPLTLRPIAYVLEGVDEVGAPLQREIPFSTTNVVKDFEEVFLHNASAAPENPRMARMNWLENNIIWEPVDGQHMVTSQKL